MNISLQTRKNGLPNHFLRMLFIDTANNRLDELDGLILKTDAAIKSCQSKYFVKRHMETMRDLNHAYVINGYILFALNANRTVK